LLALTLYNAAKGVHSFMFNDTINDNFEIEMNKLKPTTADEEMVHFIPMHMS